MSIEEPDFNIISKEKNYEIREYSPRIVAETFVDTPFDKAGSKTFKILADYIFGNNLSKSKIKMTAPVSQKKASEKIAMTVPVNQTKTNKGYSVQFTMPSKYSLETLPKPVDERVKIKQLPSKKIAVYSYSGSWSQKRFERKLKSFKSSLKKDKVNFSGEPTFARFNSPFQLWFLRRNEIWLEVLN